MAQRVRVLAVGRTRRGPLLELEQDYLARIGHFVEVRRESVPASGAPRPEDRRRDEGALLLAACGARGTAVALDARGESCDSDQFRSRLARWRERGEVTFVIGGPDGLDSAVTTSCATTLALGPMTLPHELALVVLLEQVYRALARDANHPYARH